MQLTPTPDPIERPSGYNVHTGAEIAAMLAVIGVTDIDALFADVPASVRLGRPLDLPPVLSEWALARDVRAMAALNASTLTHACYLGAGAYEHYIPAVVDAIVSRGEFLTAYTPYQPEMSQGLLQALFEFQILMGRLLGRESVNCSVYDGATAFAEGCWMLCAASGRRRVLVASSIWESYAQVLETYLLPRGVHIETVPHDAATGRLDASALARLLAQGDAAGVAIQSPNALGVIEDVQTAAALCRTAGVRLLAGVNPHLCAWVTPPGELGADIVVCEGQSLGLPLSAGGPYIGVIACDKPLERFLPGRLVGRLHDLNGKLAYALIKEDREQHVARDKATSHICSNQALNAIRVAVYLACMGEHNLRDLAQTNANNAQGLQHLLCALPGVRPLKTGGFFNEFSIELPIAAEAFCQRMRQAGIFAGTPVSPALAGHHRGLLVAVTETKTAADLVAYTRAAQHCLSQVDTAAAAQTQEAAA